MIVEAGDNKLENWLKRKKNEKKKKNGSHENVLFACKKCFTGLAQDFESGCLPYCPVSKTSFLVTDFWNFFDFQLKFEAFPLS